MKPTKPTNPMKPMASTHETVGGWGRFQPVDAQVLRPAHLDELASAPMPESDLISRGLGRSYGDAAQRSSGTAVVTTQCTQLTWHDRQRGTIRADAGVTIGQMINQFAPKGWFVPVSPGTRHVTVGGAIAADIHGKNHHVDGSFGSAVLSLRLRLASNEIITASPTENTEAFWATIGGMGLTGVILDAVVRLTSIPSTTVEVVTQRLHTLGELTNEMRRSDEQHEFSVAWVDLLGGGRSVLTQGSFARPSELANLGVHDAAGAHRRPPTPSVGLPPLPIPRVAVTPAIKAFNELWWRKAPAEPVTTGESITAFFHPLDAVSDWNRVYGRTGFVQWQCVVPDDSSDTLSILVERLASLPSYLTVLKRFGPGNQAPLSFPAPGWTLAVDLPATNKALAALHALDQIVVKAGGRIYLAKDARLERQTFEQMYPRLAEFKAIRAQLDPQRRFASDMSVRLGL